MADDSREKFSISFTLPPETVLQYMEYGVITGHTEFHRIVGKMLDFAFAIKPYIKDKKITIVDENGNDVTILLK